MRHDLSPFVLLALASSAAAVCDVNDQSAAMSSAYSGYYGSTFSCSAWIGALDSAGCTEDFNYAGYCRQISDSLQCPASTCDQLSSGGGGDDFGSAAVCDGNAQAAAITSATNMNTGQTSCSAWIGALDSAGCTRDFAYGTCPQMASGLQCPASTCDQLPSGGGGDVCDADAQTAAMTAVMLSDSSLQDGPTDCAGVNTFVGAMVAVGCTEDSVVADDPTYTWGTYCSIYADGYGCPEKCDQLKSDYGGACDWTTNWYPIILIGSLVGALLTGIPSTILGSLPCCCGKCLETKKVLAYIGLVLGIISMFIPFIVSMIATDIAIDKHCGDTACAPNGCTAAEEQAGRDVLNALGFLVAYTVGQGYIALVTGIAGIVTSIFTLCNCCKAKGEAAPAAAAGVTVVNKGTEPPNGAHFDPNTGAPIPKFDPETGKQNW